MIIFRGQRSGGVGAVLNSLTYLTLPFTIKTQQRAK